MNGDYQGKGVTRTSVQRNKNVAILVKKEGFQPVQRHIQTKISGLGLLDVVSGCVLIFPWIGLFFPGAWSLNEENVAILLEKAQ